jgi:hypothetical protein
MSDTSTPPDVPNLTVVNVPSGDRGDLLVQSFYTHSTDCIFDIHIQDLDAQSYSTQDPEKCLIASENEKKCKYQQKCHEQQNLCSLCGFS